MKHKSDVEAVLERSLRKQVRVPRLDESFDAAVWARIAVEESKSMSPVPVRQSSASKVGRWMFVVNAVGIASVAVVLCVFMFQWIAGLQVGEGSMPDLSALMSQQSVSNWSTGIAGAALLFGFLYTPWGRRLLNELF